MISADGRVLSRTNLKAYAPFSYRVFAENSGAFRPFDGPMADVSPHPTGIAYSVPFPPFVSSNLVTIEGLNHGPGGAPDPWLSDDQTETIGNNVEAQLPSLAPGGQPYPNLGATTTSAHTFDRAYDLTAIPYASAEQEQASATSLFYLVNYFHDFWYDAGFTEVAGNGQTSNLGRGGEEGDAITVYGAGINYSSMSTPDDGLTPQMFIGYWDGPEQRSLSISTATATRPARTVRVRFGNHVFSVTGSVILAPTTGDSPGTACDPIPDATGKIVLVRVGVCAEKTQAFQVQLAHGVGMLVIARGNSPVLDSGPPTDPITIGVMAIDDRDSQALLDDLAAGPVTATLNRDAGVDYVDGAFDATLVAHEFGHFLHRRLAACSFGSKLCDDLSEGWGDFAALLATARSGDDLDGAYAVGGFATVGASQDSIYFGLRRAPYSTNQEIDPRTFRYMVADQLPAGTSQHPFLEQGADPATNHPAGEVWASMLWDGYVALQKQPGAVFEEARDRMRQYVELAVPVTNTGEAALETATATLTSSLPSVQVAKPSQEIGPLAVGATKIVKFRVALDPALATPEVNDVRIEISASGACESAVLSSESVVNLDEAAATSSTDNFGSSVSLWTPSVVPIVGAETLTQPWILERTSATDGDWRGVVPDLQQDTRLTSPVLQAGADEITMTFSHRYSFPYVAKSIETVLHYFAGGSVEYTTDAGATWTDISALDPTVPYDHPVGVDGAAGPPVFVGISTSPSDYQRVTLHLGTALANQTFQVRFRIQGEGAGLGGMGWRIDDVGFTGLAVAPFPTQSPETGPCDVVPDPEGDPTTPPDQGTHDGSGCCQASGAGSGNAVMAFGILMLVRRRRRRG